MGVTGVGVTGVGGALIVKRQKRRTFIRENVGGAARGSMMAQRIKRCDMRIDTMTSSSVCGRRVCLPGGALRRNAAIKKKIEKYWVNIISRPFVPEAMGTGVGRTDGIGAGVGGAVAVESHGKHVWRDVEMMEGAERFSHSIR